MNLGKISRHNVKCINCFFLYMYHKVEVEQDGKRRNYIIFKQNIEEI